MAWWADHIHGTPIPGDPLAPPPEYKTLPDEPGDWFVWCSEPADEAGWHVQRFERIEGRIVRRVFWRRKGLWFSMHEGPQLGIYAKVQPPPPPASAFPSAGKSAAERLRALTDDISVKAGLTGAQFDELVEIAGELEGRES